MSLEQKEATIPFLQNLIVKGVLEPISRMPKVFSQANLFVAIEGNHDWTIADYIASVFKDSIYDGREVSFTSKVSNNVSKIGFWTTRETKEEGCMLAVSLFKSPGGIVFYKHFFGDKQLLLDQCGRMRRIRKSIDAEGNDRFSLTGKMRSKRANVEKQDDQVISFLIALVELHRLIEASRPSKRTRFD